MQIKKVGFGGGCHWCTEAVFESLKGVKKVEQGFIKSVDEHAFFSEAVIVHFDSKVILLQDLIEIHLHTHQSTSNHSFRKKYRSAIYYFSISEKELLQNILDSLQLQFELPLITKILPFDEFKPSRDELHNYYLKNPKKPFCKQYINPKLNLLREKYSASVK